MSGGDGIFAYRHGIAVAQTVLFTASLGAAIYFKIGHRNGWFCIGVFSIFRVIGAGCMLGTIANDSTSVWAGVFVCESFGMVLIIFLLLEFMLRANKVLHTVHARWFWYPQVITWADIGLAVGGFISAAHSDSLAPTKYTQASFGLFTGLYLIVVVTFFWFWRARNSFPRDERLAILCVAVCLPLLALRTAYSLVYQITGERAWNAVKGNSTAYLIGTFLPELVIIYASCWVILQISPPPSKKKDKKGGREDGFALVGSRQESMDGRSEPVGYQSQTQGTRLETSA